MQVKIRLKNAKQWASGRRGGYAIACAALLAATIIRMLLHPVFGGNSPFMTFVVAALLIEFFYGLGPALLAAGAGILIGIYYFVPPFGELLWPESGDAIYVIGYLVVVLLGITIIEILQRSRHELRLLREVAQARLEMLERSHADRAVAIEAARASDMRYSEIAARGRDVLYMRRLDGHFEYVNDEYYALTGLASGALDANGWSHAVHPDDLAGVQRQWQEVAVSGIEQPSDFRIRDATGD